MSAGRSYSDAIEKLNATIQNVTCLHPMKPGELRKLRSGRVRLFLPMIGITDKDLESLNIVHVAGSKGKGSTCSTVESVLRNLGYRTGFLSSPHLIKVEERIRIDGRPIESDKFARLFFDVREGILAARDKDTPEPTYLHYLVLMAFKAFVTEKVDAAIIEVGIGGRYDHTNFFDKPAVTAVTTLSLEHTEILGDTLEEIAWKKAGVFKAGCPAVVSCDQTEGTMKVFEDESFTVGCPLFCAPTLEQFYTDKETENQLLSTLAPTKDNSGPLTSGVRLRNLCLSLAVVHLWLERRKGVHFDVTGPQAPLKISLDTKQLKGALATKWPGRWQKVQRGNVTYFIDGAHTEDSVRNSAEWFQWETTKLSSKSVPRVLIYTCLGKRNPLPMLEALQDVVKPTFDLALFANPHDGGDLIVPSSKRSMEDSCLALWRELPNSAAPSFCIPTATLFTNWIANFPNDLPKDLFKAFPNKPASVTSNGGDIPSDAGECDACHVLVTGSLYIVGSILRALNEPI